MHDWLRGVRREVEAYLLDGMRYLQRSGLPLPSEDEWNLQVNQLCERRLILHMSSGDRDAWAYFEGNYGPLMRRVLIHAGIHAQDLDDVYMALLEHLAPRKPCHGLCKFEFRCSLSTFLTKCAYQFSARWLSRARVKEVPGYSARFWLESELRDEMREDYGRRVDVTDTPTVEDRVILRLALVEGLRQLRTSSRQCLLLKAEGLSDRQIADRVGLKLRTVQKTLERARTKMQAWLRDSSAETGLFSVEPAQETSDTSSVSQFGRVGTQA